MIGKSSVSLAALGMMLSFTLSTNLQAGPAMQYQALGDSYSSGSGTAIRDLDFSCYRSSGAYAAVVAESDSNIELTAFNACQGDITDDLIASQTSTLDRKTDIVSFSIGGNDVGFVELILNCANYFDEWMCMNTAETIEHRIQFELPDKLQAAYADIKQGAPNAQLIQVGYPRMFGSDVSCWAASGINANEAARLNAISDTLDAVIAAEAAKAGVTYVSTIAAFTGHDVCADQPYVNGKNFLFIEDVFHPTADGHRYGTAPLVLEAIQ
ncbi:MAG: SGNH/GDSL hydrolase family protein [Oleiphilaceae bacterium]|nr:SGNH/GDSL hydrolase family protein [Oleiphilaceae bacterium]